MDYSEERQLRVDPIMISIVKELEEKANGPCSYIKIIEIPDNVDWIIEEYDGKEWVAENHRTWE